MRRGRRPGVQGGGNARRGRAGEGGYTLIEMSVVLLILGILMFVVVARVDNLLPRYRSRASVREIAATLRLARAEAMSTGMPHYVQYDVPKGRFWILSPEPVVEGDPLEEPPDVSSTAFKEYEYTWVKTMERALPEGVVFEKILWSADLAAEQMPVTIECTPYGSVRSHTIWLTGKEDQSKFTISADPLTGFVNLEEGHVEPLALEEAPEK